MNDDIVLKQERASLEKRLWNKVDVRGEDECWLWKGERNAKGYGRIYVDNRIAAQFGNQGDVLKVTRVVFWLKTGQVPDARSHVCHKCDNPACCNPAHLFMGTALDNVRDAMQKGRHVHGETHGCAVLTDEDVIKIREMWKRGDPLLSIAKKFGVSERTARDAATGAQWSHLPNPGKLRNPIKLNLESAMEIRELHRGGTSVIQIAEMYEVHVCTIRNVLNGKTWNGKRAFVSEQEDE